MYYVQTEFFCLFLYSRFGTTRLLKVVWYFSLSRYLQIENFSRRWNNLRLKQYLVIIYFVTIFIIYCFHSASLLCLHVKNVHIKHQNKIWIFIIYPHPNKTFTKVVGTKMYYILRKRVLQEPSSSKVLTKVSLRYFKLVKKKFHTAQFVFLYEMEQLFI